MKHHCWDEGDNNNEETSNLSESDKSKDEKAKIVSFFEDIEYGNQHTTSTWPWCCNKGVEETTVDKLQAEATTVDDEQQADVRMVAPTATYNNQHACCVLGVPTFFHPHIISIPLTLNIGGINGMKRFQ